MNVSHPNASDTRKNREDRVCGDEPMTAAQAACLRMLAEEAHEPFQFRKNMTKAEASKLIDQFRAKVGVTDESTVSSMSPAEAIKDRIVGTAKQIAGQIVGDEALHDKGKAQDEKGRQHNEEAGDLKPFGNLDRLT